MNRLSYRIIFNTKRGQLVAVAECTSGQGKSCGERAAKRRSGDLHGGLHAKIRGGLLCATAFAALLATQPVAWAQVIADPTAPANQRPTVLTNPTGGPLVNIQTPSAAGVSRNTYSQFDVGSSQTVVLNNNRFSNPWLATGSARVILNEVNSSNPSNLAGQITVEGFAPGGARTDVVFANPSGININGVNFFGAGRVTMTTGAPVVTGGALTGFNVTKGNIDIASMGMAVNGAGSFADIISRSAVIGGVVRADQAINVVTGPQSVDYATGATTPLTGAGTKPALAIDTKALGGMYAGSITLLSTEAGVGVRNQGTLQANTGSGQLIVTADGRLENTGRMDSAYTSVATVAGNIDNSGKLLGRKLLMASAGADFNHSGDGMAQNEAATSPLTDQMHTAFNIGSGMAQDTGSASQVFINAKQNVKLIYGASGSRIASNASVTAADGSVTKGQVVISAGRNVGLSALTAVNASGPVQISSGGDVYGSWNSVSSASDGVSILAKNGISLSGSSVEGNTVHLETGAAFEESVSRIAITGGSIIGKQQTAVIATGDLNLSTAGTNGVKSTYGSIFLHSGKNISLAGGTKVLASKHLTASAAESINFQGVSGATADSNQVASTLSGGDTTLSAGKVVLQGGNVEAGGSIEIEASKSDVLIHALPDLTLNTHAAFSLNNSSCCTSSPIQTAATNSAPILKANNGLSISAYNGGVFAKGLQASGSDVSIVSNGIIQIDRVENVAPTKFSSPLKSNIIARGDLTIGSIHETGLIELLGSTLTATGQAKVIGNGAVNLLSTATSHTLSDGGKVTTTSRAEISGAGVTVQGGSVSAEGLLMSAKNGHANIGATSGDARLDFGGMAYTEVNATGNVAVHANKDVNAQNVQATAGKNLAVTSATGTIASTRGTLTAKDMLSLSSKGAQTHVSSTFTGGAMSVYNQTGVQTLNGTTLRSTNTAALSGVSGQLNVESGGGVTADTTTMLDAATDLAVVTGTGGITIAPDRSFSAPEGGLLLTANQLKAGRDITVVARNGAMALAGSGGTNGNATARVLRLNAQRDLTLIGSAVQIQGSNLGAGRDVNIASHAGNVLIDGVKNSFVAYSPTERLAVLRLDRAIYENQVAIETARRNANPQYAALVATYQQTLARPTSSWGSGLNASLARTVELTRLIALMSPYEADLLAAQQALREFDAVISFLATNSTGAEHQGANITGRDINITSAAGIAVYGADIKASGSANLKSSGLLPIDSSVPPEELGKPVGMLLAGLTDFYEIGAPSAANHAYAVMSRPTVITGQTGVTIQAAGDATASAANLPRLVINDSAVKSSASTVNLHSLGDMRLEAGQEEFYSKTTNIYTKRSWYGKKKTTTVIATNQSVQPSPVVLEGRNLAIKSGGTIDAYATAFLAPQGAIQVTAANALNLHAVDQLNSSTVNTTTRSSWIGFKYRETNTTSTRTVQEQLPSRLAATMVSAQSGWNIVLQGTQIHSSLLGPQIAPGQGPDARADAQAILLPIKKTVTESKTKESNYVVWQRQLGSGSTVETMTLPSFTGPQRPVFNAPGGLVVQVPAGELTTQIQTLSQQPGMAYLNELSQRRDVNWQQVKLAHDQWSYKQEGLTPAGAALLGAAVAWATGGMGANLVGGTVTNATTGAVSTTLGGHMANAAFMSLASQAAITLVNNKGNIGKTLSDLAKSDIVKATIAAALTAGAMAQLNAIPGMADLGDKLKAGTAGLSEKLTYNLINAGGRALTNTAINGGNLEEALKQALVGGLVDTAHGEVASKIKVLEGEYLAHKLAHALAGCVAGAAASGTCRDGAIGSAVGEVVAEMFDGQKPAAGATREQLIAFDQKVLATSKIVAGAVAAYTGGNAQAAITTAEVAVQNNYLSKPQLTALQNELNACKQNNCTEAQTNAVLDKYVKLSASNDAALAACTTTACVEQHRKTIAEASALSLEVKHQVGNLLASERLISELQGREKLSNGSTVQQLYARAERIEQARKQLDQYVQSQCVGLSSAACTTKLQSSQATAGVVTEIFAGFTPAGFAVDIKDLLQANTMQDRSLAVLGIVLPGLGDGVKALVKGAKGVGTGTVFDSIRPTQPTYPGSIIPRSFEMTLPNGQNVWVAGNATEHMVEFAQMKSINYTPEAVRLASQEQLTSLQAAINAATIGGIPYDQLLNVGGWELKFAPPRQSGQFPSVIHARPRSMR